MVFDFEFGFGKASGFFYMGFYIIFISEIGLGWVGLGWFSFGLVRFRWFGLFDVVWFWVGLGRNENIHNT